jgi:hypothetical protein
MIKSKAVCLAYETVEKKDRSLPLLVPMSEVAGRMSVQEGAKFLEKPIQSGKNKKPIVSVALGFMGFCLVAGFIVNKGLENLTGCLNILWQRQIHRGHLCNLSTYLIEKLISKINIL